MASGFKTKMALIISMQAYEQIASKRVKSSSRVPNNHE